MITRSIAAALALAALLATSGSSVGAEEAQMDPDAGVEEAQTDSDAGSSSPAGHGYPVGALSSAPEDPGNLVPGIHERRKQKESIFPLSPLYWLHEQSDRGKQVLEDSVGLKLALAYTQVFMVLSESLPDSDIWGTNSNVDMLVTWELLMRGKPAQGQVTAHGQGRWDWGTTAPEDLAEVSLGSLLGTANSFGPYDSIFLLRNLYWEQGSKEAGWAYRIGKITPDAMLGNSAHMANVLTFLPTANFNFSIAVPDSGLGGAAVWYPCDRIRLMGLVSDSNADRQDWGDIGEGDLFKAIDLGVQIAPRTEKAGYSKLVFWHNDGTSDGSASNGNLGPKGWGFLLKLEQELTADGQVVGIVRYGTSFNDSAFYKHQAGANVLFYDPPPFHRIRNDVVGVAFNWVRPTPTGDRDEFDLEFFYRFPLFPLVDVTLSYQSIFNPVLDPDNTHAAAFGLRLRTTF
jgi:hypothetical protein